LLGISDKPNGRYGLAGLLGAERGELPALGLLVALAFVLATSFVLVQTTADGLFIEEYGAHALPLAYLSIAAFASSVAFVYLWLSERLAPRTALFVNLAFLALMCVVFWIGLRSHVAHWFIFFLPFFFQTLVNLANLIVWPVAGQIFDVRQAKRLFGLVGAGTWGANLAGGFVIAPILAITGTANLYLMAAAALIVAAPVLWLTLKRHIGAPKTQLAANSRKARHPESHGTSPFANPYSRLIFAYILLSWLGFCFIDNIFFDRAELRYPTSAQLAGFIGQQLSVIGLIAIVTTMFLTSRIVGRFGLRAGLLVMPVSVTACIAAVAVGGALGIPEAMLFWMAVLAKTVNVSLGFSLSQATGILLYQPLLGHQRHRTETIAEGIMQPLAFGLAGLLLLPFATSLHFDAVRLAFLFMPVAGLWLWVIIRIADQYPAVVSEALRKRSLGESTTLLFDPAGLAQLQNGLRSTRASVVLYALNQLQQLDPRAWRKSFLEELPGLLAHPAPEVRREVLQRLLSMRPQEALPLVRGRLDEEGDGQVRSLLIHVLAALDDESSVSPIADALASRDPAVRSGAILGLLACGNPRRTRRAGGILRQMAGASDARERALAAELIGQSADADSAELLAGLLADGIVAVRKAAILASARQANRFMLERIILACDDPQTAPIAERVLVSKGLASVEVISGHLTSGGDEPMPRRRLRSLVRVLGGISEERAGDLLRSEMKTPDPEIRLQVLRALSAHGYRAMSVDGVPQQLRSELDFAGSIAGAIKALEDASERRQVQYLLDALESAFREARSRVLLLLSFLYEASPILRAERTLGEKAASRLAHAAESVDALLPARLRPVVLPLLEEAPYARRLSQWQAAGMQITVPSIEALIAVLIGARSPSPYSDWTRMCAMQAASMLGIRSSEPALRELGDAPEEALRQSSRLSLGRLLSGSAVQGGREMLSLVEKVLILKSANLFSETPDNVLADIAGLAEEQLMDPGQIIFNKGDAGDSLYVIVSGSVDVLDGDRRLNSLGEGDIFGELALLDPEPRLATVVATEYAHLLRLDESSFQIILAERPEVSAAIIRVITRYLRSLLRHAGDFDPNLPPREPRGPAGEASTAGA
jgi:ATP/ADP translocase/HEAT repeat protein